MDLLMKLIRQMIDSGRHHARHGLLYEAAYRYGQAITMINTLYILHSQDVLALPQAIQSKLAQLREKTAILADSLQHSAGNGRHKMGDAEQDAKGSLIQVIGMLQEDILTGWLT